VLATARVQVAFDNPFEKQLHQPAAFVKLGDDGPARRKLLVKKVKRQ
jgi:hypothetical protein